MEHMRICKYCKCSSVIFKNKISLNNLKSRLQCSSRQSSGPKHVTFHLKLILRIEDLYSRIRSFR